MSTKTERDYIIRAAKEALNKLDKLKESHPTLSRTEGFADIENIVSNLQYEAENDELGAYE